MPIYLSYYIEEAQTKTLHRLNLYLDPEETMSAFAQLNKVNPQSAPIELFLSIDQAVRDIDVYVIKGQQTIELKKIQGQIDDLYNR